MAHYKHALLTATFLSVSLWSAGAEAEAVAEPQASAGGVVDSSYRGLEEIIVTAQRRSENILAVPLSIQAFSGQHLETKQITTLTDLQFITPGYFSASSGGFTQLYIRGVGNSIFVGADPSVATYVDDVPHIWGSASQDLINVERVEVLKGAQGGLYGRNATGGVVNIVTRKPSMSELQADAVVSYGEKNTFRAAGYVNIPLSDKVAFSIAAERSTHDPYVRNENVQNPYTASMFTGTSLFGTPAETAAALNSQVGRLDLGNRRFFALTGKLLIEPTSNLSITLAADYNNKDDTDGNQNTNLNPEVAQGFLNGFFGAFGINANLPEGFLKGPSGKFRTTYGEQAAINTLKEHGGSGTIIWSLPGVDITSISAYRHQSTVNLASAAATSVPIILPNAVNERRFYFQELRFTSTFDGPLSFIGGASYLNNRAATDLAMTAFGTLVPTVVVGAVTVTKNWSAYLQGTYDITDRLSVTGSGRYIRENSETDFALPTPSEFSLVQKKFLPAATISYKIGDGNVYVRYARGFKAGGVNPITPPEIFPSPEDGAIFKSEQVDTFEAGFRQSFLDRRLQSTTAIFYNDYRDLQYNARANEAYSATVVLAITNGDSARSYGVEQSFVYRVLPELTLNVSGGYLNAKYKDFKLQGNPVLSDFDLSGQQMINAPKWQFNFGADLDQPLNDDVRLVGGIMTSHLSTIRFQQTVLPGVMPDSAQPAYWLTNMRLGLEIQDRYGISLTARNVFNKGYYVFGNSNPFGTVVTWGNPRIIGISLTAKY